MCRRQFLQQQGPTSQGAEEVARVEELARVEASARARHIREIGQFMLRRNELHNPYDATTRDDGGESPQNSGMYS